VLNQERGIRLDEGIVPANAAMQLDAIYQAKSVMPLDCLNIVELPRGNHFTKFNYCFSFV